MNLTIPQVAAMLGKSERQVRYLISKGELPARKDGGTWVIDDAALPRSDGQTAAQDRRQRQMRDAVEDVLGVSAPERRRFSICDLRAFQVGLPLLRRCEAELGGEHAATRALRAALRQLSLGCHHFERRDKAGAYRAAREAASEAAFELALSEAPAAPALLDLVEQDLLAAIAGLLRRMDRRPAA